MSETGTEVIEYHPEENRYTISVDGEQAGFAAYTDTDAGRDFDHTVIDKAFGGRGLAGKVVGKALADTVADGKAIIPSCSFVHRYVTKNPEYLAHVPAQTRAAMDLPDPA